jgi:putative ABC transport system permease protein
MNDAAIGWTGLGLSLILVGVAVGLSLWQGLRLEKDMLWATGRALVQLLAVGYVLVYIVDPDTPIVWAWVWVVLMLLVASFTARRRAPEVPGMMRLTLGATSASAALSLFVVFGLGMCPVVGRAVVPIAGMMIGNSIGSIVVASRRILGELGDRRPEVEARLALGQPWQQASAVRAFPRCAASRPRSRAPRRSAWCSCPGR